MKDWTKAKAGDVMTTPLVTVDRDMSISEAALTLIEHRISGAPVVDYGDKPLGVVSLFDLVSYVSGLGRAEGEPAGFYRYSYPKSREGTEAWDKSFWDEVEANPLKENQVGEIMNAEIFGVEEDKPLPGVIDLMWKKRIHRVFVLRKERPVGVITTMDILGLLAGAPRRAKAEAKHTA